MDKIIKLNLNLPANYKLFSTLLLGYSKFEDEEEILRNYKPGQKRKLFDNMKIFWKRKKYEQI